MNFFEKWIKLASFSYFSIILEIKKKPVSEKKRKRKVSVFYYGRLLSYFLLICTSCGIAIPHDSTVNAIGNTPLVRVSRSPEISAPFAYIASTTGRITSIMTYLYFAILDTPCCFWNCAVIYFHMVGDPLVFRRDRTFWIPQIQYLNFFKNIVQILNISKNDDRNSENFKLISPKGS